MSENRSSIPSIQDARRARSDAAQLFDLYATAMGLLETGAVLARDGSQVVGFTAMNLTADPGDGIPRPHMKVVVKKTLDGRPCEEVHHVDNNPASRRGLDERAITAVGAVAVWQDIHPSQVKWEELQQQWQKRSAKPTIVKGQSTSPGGADIFVFRPKNT